MIIKKPNDEKKEKGIDKMKDEYLEAQQAASELRKKGMDTFIADTLLLEIPAKLKMAGITQEDHDLERVEKAIGDVRKEIEDINVGSDFDRVAELIQECFEHLRKGEKGDAREKYREIMALYKLLPTEMKKTVVEACMELRSRVE